MTTLRDELEAVLAEGRPYILVSVIEGRQMETLFGGNPHITWRDVAKMLAYATVTAEARASEQEQQMAGNQIGVSPLGLASNVGGSTETVGDAVAARNQRLARAEHYRDHHEVDWDLRARLAGWVEKGGPVPWELTGQDYPPVQPV